MRQSNKLIDLIFIISASAVHIVLPYQQLTHDAVVINIEVPVRVFKGNTFVDNLTLNDFEVYEDGVLQKIEAVYLIRKTKIEMKEEEKKFAPETSRNFYLFFNITEYTSKIEKALNYFFKHVLVPGDNLTVITPYKTYNMKKETLELLSKEEIIRQLKTKLKKDAWAGNSEYRSIMFELKRFVIALGGEIKSPELADAGDEPIPIQTYEALLSKLESLRRIDEKMLLDFAQFLKEKEGQNYVFLFYQREFLPQLAPQAFDRLSESIAIQSLFGYFFREVSFNVEKVKKAYADSSASIHFLFFTKPAEYVPGIRMEEHSEDIFNPFREIALATGGSVQSSANPEYLFQKASDASENYYLLYYSPKDYKANGEFRNIKVRVKNNDYRLSHRLGYFAN